MRVFLDTNVLLDVIEARPGLVEESSDVLTLGESWNIERRTLNEEEGIDDC